MMAISSRRVKVASLIVLLMMKKLTIMRMIIRASEMRLTTLRTEINASAYSICAFTSATPSTASMSGFVCSIRLISVRWMMYLWRKTVSSRLSKRSSS